MAAAKRGRNAGPQAPSSTKSSPARAVPTATSPVGGVWGFWGVVWVLFECFFGCFWVFSGFILGVVWMFHGCLVVAGVWEFLGA